jgi:hypothetical protein
MLIFHAVVTAVVMGFAQPARAQSGDGTWHITGRVSATACAGDRCATRRQRIDKTVVVTNGQISNLNELGVLCESALTLDLSTLGEYVPARRGWQRFHVTNRPLLRSVLRDCLGYRVTAIQSFAARVRTGPDGQTFAERMHTALTLVVRGQTVNVTAGGRIDGALVTAPATRSAAEASIRLDELIDTLGLP